MAAVERLGSSFSKTPAGRIPDNRMTTRSVVLASADPGLRQRLVRELTGMRWTVFEAGGGAEAMACVERARPEALLLDSYLPDLEVREFSEHIGMMFPGLDILRIDGISAQTGKDARSPRRNELLHAIREAQDADLAEPMHAAPQVEALAQQAAATEDREAELLPEMLGVSAPMRELARLIRLVAPRRTSVLIEGETGSGKEVVAKALHRLSTRSARAFVVLNCAAIPESLLEAELFGHTRGAFTGAVTSRTGRIEAANGGTLFLDEIGEMPLALQAKMLRFLECGELQRVGDNETVRVDVRVIAATHQPLEQRSAEGRFRLDLYHRLAVFPLEVPALRDRLEDLPLLIEHFLEQMGREMPRKRLAPAAIDVLLKHSWEGNIRELMHVLERGAILAGNRAEIGVAEIRLHSRRTA